MVHELRIGRTTTIAPPLRHPARRARRLVERPGRGRTAGASPAPGPSPLRGNRRAPPQRPEARAEFVADFAPEGTRHDGWTPFARKLFLQVLAETGRVSLALAYTGLSKQSAHALRNRDPLFAAGWDAAALMARNPLADDISRKASTA